MKKVVLLRHGESTWNRENRFTGWTDVDLSEKGVAEAARAGELLRKEGFLFGPAYLLYRKMWKEGLLTALLSIVLSVPSLIAIVATFNPSLFGSMPLHWVPVAADVCAIADWIVRILLGLFSVWLYRNTSKKNIDKIYSEYPEGDARTDALLKAVEELR